MYVDAAVDADDRTAHNDAPALILVVIMRASLDHVRPASILLGLTRRHSAVSPTRFLALTPSGRVRVAIVSPVLVSAASLPRAIVVIGAGGVRVSFPLSLGTIRPCSRRAQSNATGKDNDSEPMFAHIFPDSQPWFVPGQSMLRSPGLHVTSVPGP